MINMQTLNNIKMDIIKRVKVSVLSYASLFFINDIRFGVIFLVISFFNPNIGASGVWGLLSLQLFDYFVGKNDKLEIESYLLYNTLLVSIGIGFVFRLDIFVLLIITFLSVSTYLISILTKSILAKYHLPVLSIPFCIVMLLFFLAKGQYTNLYYAFNPFLIVDIKLTGLPFNLSLFFKSIGFIIFSPYVLSGLSIFILIFIRSRSIAIIMLASFYYGTWIEEYLTAIEWSDTSLIYSYNYILVAVGLGAVFMLPTIKSLLIMPFAIALSILINDALLTFFSPTNIPIFTASFNITIIVFLYSLRSLHFNNFPTSYGRTPEETLDWSLLDQKNKKFKIRILPPFIGNSYIYQSFDDKWTHRGLWKHALDFVYKDNNGNSFKQSKLQKENYYCFSAPVYAPISGVVSDICMEYRDNEIGCVDTKNNWGNYIIIKSSEEFYVLLCHLKQNSSILKSGDYIAYGQVIALCGNSGYSPEPHLHMHVQLSSFLGSETVPFYLDQYIDDNKKFKSGKIPKRGDSIHYSLFQKNSHVLPHNLDRKITYLYNDNKLSKPKIIEINTKVDEQTGRFFLKDNDNNKLYITKNNSGVSFDYFQGTIDSCLAKIYASIPGIPYYYEHNLHWQLPLSIKISKSPISFYFRFLFSYFFMDMKQDIAKLKFDNDDKKIIFSSSFKGRPIHGKVKLSEIGDIMLIESNNFSIRKIY